MLTDRQVQLLRLKLAENKTIGAAAAAADMSVRSAHAWKSGPLPSQTKRPRHWRTRKDVFADIWDAEVVPLLQRDEDGVLEATTVMGELRRVHGSRFSNKHLRTLQRRLRDWRAHHGPEREVFFEQQHLAGREAAIDFTDCSSLGIRIAGEFFAHLLFQFVLTFSKWRSVTLAFSETFEALMGGLQDALWRLGGVPEVVRSDNLSAATHELPSGGRELNRRFAQVLEHYGVRSTRIEPGKSHQNGVVEKANDLLKSALEQALIVRGSRDFTSVGEYVAFVETITARLNAAAEARFAEEKAALRPLPAARLPAYTTYDAVVRKWSTIHFAKRTYSVPSRLRDCAVEVRLHPDIVEVFYRKKLAVTMPRLRGEKQHRIDYRHVIWSLVKKPGAFARYRYREELFPSLTFRRAYDALVDARGERADIEYVRILHLAASTFESRVEAALAALLEQGRRFDYADVKAIAAPEQSPVPDVHIPRPDPTAYDALLLRTGGQP
jgi:transposase